MSWWAEATGSFRGTAAAAVLVAASLGVAGCGFQPLYGAGGGAAAMPGGEGLPAVEIARIANRPGQKLRNALIDRMHRDGAVDSIYALNVGYTAAEQKLAVSKDSSTERVQLVFRAPYTLTRKKDGAVLLRTTARTNIVYDFLDEQYGLLAAREDAYNRAIIETADEITMRVAAAIGHAADKPSEPAKAP